MNYSIYFLFACLVAAHGYVVRSPTPLTNNFDDLKTKDSQSPLITADPSQGRISLPRHVVSPTSDYRYTNPIHIATAQYRQKRIMQLLVDLNELSTIPEIAETAKNWSLVYNLEHFVDDEAVEDYWTLQQEGLIFRNKKFSIFNERHKNEAISLFKVFYSAKDFETFYKTAAWARQNNNEGCFMYALTLALLHRADTRDITLPALYEIYPWYFVRGDILRKVEIMETQMAPTSNDEEIYLGARVVNGTAIFSAEMADSIMYNNNKEVTLAYFTEDIGLNMFYYYQQMMNPHWLKTNDENTKFGENWYYFHQQMLARYYLERLSNNLGEIPDFSWDDTIETGYNPALIYPDGGIFPSRKDIYTIEAEGNTDYLMFVKTYERTLAELLKSDDFLNMNGGMNLALENIVASIFKPEILSSNFRGKNYDAIARYLLGASRGLDEHKEFGFSAMEHHETSLRDHMFWQLQKHIMNFLFTYKNLLPRYTETELNFPGVKITNVDITKLNTQYEYYEIDLNKVHPRTTEGEEIYEPLNIKVAQTKLNHKPFMVKISVNSERAVESVVRIFIAPKVDGNGRILDLDANRYNFVELDSFLYTLNPGDNIIVRKSEAFKNIAGDSMPMSEMFDKVESALLGLDLFRMNKNETFTGFPSRLLIPKGTKTGFLVQMFVIVSPFMRQGYVYNYGNHIESNYYDNGISLGYPFDRRIETSDFYQLNMFMKDVAITHKGKENAKSGNGKPTMVPNGKNAEYGSKMLSQGASTPYDYSSRKSFDYMAKKAAREDMDYGTKSSDASNIEVENQHVNAMPSNMDNSIQPVTTDLSFEDETIKLFNNSYSNVDFDQSLKDPENSLIIDEAYTGHGLLKYSGNNDQFKNKFDYAAKRDAKKALQNEYNQKIDDNQPEDDSSNTNKIDADSMIADKMNIDISANPTIDHTERMHRINGNSVLLRSSGIFDYPRKKFDYEAKRNAIKDLENGKDLKIDNHQLKDDTSDTEELFSPVDTDKMDIDMMFAEQTNTDTRNRNNFIGHNSDIDADDRVIPIMNLHLYEIVADRNELDRGLLRSSGKYDYSDDKFDYSIKKKERKEVERARKEALKMIIKTSKDNAIIVDKDSNGVLDIKYIDNIDGDTENMVKHNVYQIGEENPDSDSSMDMLVRSVGKYDYSNDKFDYSSKKKERKDIQSSEKKGRKLMIKTKKNDAMLINKDIDGVLDMKYKDDIDSTTEHMVEYNVHQTTEPSTDLDSEINILNENENYSRDGASDSVYNATRNTLNENYDTHNQEILDNVLLKSTGNTQIDYSKNYMKQLEKELKKAMKAERKLAAAEEKKIRDSNNVPDKVSDTHELERQDESVIYRDDTYGHGKDGMSPTNIDELNIVESDFEDFSKQEDRFIHKSPDVTIQDNKDVAIGLADSTNKYPDNIHDYVFYDNFYPIYE